MESGQGVLGTVRQDLHEFKCCNFWVKYFFFKDCSSCYAQQCPSFFWGRWRKEGDKRPRKNFECTYTLVLISSFLPFSPIHLLLHTSAPFPLTHSSPLLTHSFLFPPSEPSPPPTLFFSPSFLHVHYATLCIFHNFVNPIMSAKAESIAELVAHCKIHQARNLSRKGN